MSKKSEEFIENLLSFLPSARDEYLESVERYGEVLESIIIEDVFMPKIIQLLTANNDFILLNRIFNYFEDVANCGEEYIINLFTITVLENLGNEKSILDTAIKYMGPKTKQLQIKADTDLGRIKISG